MYLGLSDINHIIENLELELYPIKSKSFMLLVEEENELTLISNMNNFMYLYLCEDKYECLLYKTDSGVITDEDEYTYFDDFELECSMLNQNDNNIYCDYEYSDDSNADVLHRLISSYHTTLSMIYIYII